MAPGSSGPGVGVAFGSSRCVGFDDDGGAEESLSGLVVAGFSRGLTFAFGLFLGFALVDLQCCLAAAASPTCTAAWWAA